MSWSSAGPGLILGFCTLAVLFNRPEFEFCYISPVRMVPVRMVAVGCSVKSV